MDRRFFAAIMLCMIFMQHACDDAKNKTVDIAAEREPDLTSFRRVKLDSGYLSRQTSSTTKEEVKEASVEKLIEPKTEKLARPPKPLKKKGVIVFDSMIYHLPDMAEGDKTSIDLGFTNKGEVPLSIREVDVVCGCTTPEVPFLDILPGEKGKIGILYNSVSKEGPQELEITVISNGRPRKTVLKILVNVLPQKKLTLDSSDTKS